MIATAHCSSCIFFLGQVKTIYFYCFHFVKDCQKWASFIFIGKAAPQRTSVYRYTTSFFTSSACALYFIREINMCYSFCKFLSNFCSHRRACNPQTERDCNQETRIERDCDRFYDVPSAIVREF